MKMGFFGFLGLLFIALKLMHFIDWSWWLVTLPLYGGAAFTLIVLFFAAFIAAVSGGNRK